MAPTTSPNPQLSQQAIIETTVIKIIADVGDLGTPAAAFIALFTSGAVASAVPRTSTKAICIENPSNDHILSPQALAISNGFILLTGIAAINTNMVSMIQKINASGKNF